MPKKKEMTPEQTDNTAAVAAAPSDDFQSELIERSKMKGTITAAEVLDIIDDGDGISPARISSILRGDAYKNGKEGAVGIYNVNIRLINYFGHDYALVIQSENKPSFGTKVTIKVPLKYE